jgi:hypothetical protein
MPGRYHRAGHGKGLRELLYAVSCVGLQNEVQRMLVIHDCSAVDVDASFGSAGIPQVLQQRLAHLWVFGRAALRRVLMTDDEQGHLIAAE